MYIYERFQILCTRKGRKTIALRILYGCAAIWLTTCLCQKTNPALESGAPSPLRDRFTTTKQTVGTCKTSHATQTPTSIKLVSEQ